jgi:hypothetical protein
MRPACALTASLLTLLAACSRPETPAITTSNSPSSEDPARPLPSPLPEVVARVDGQPIFFAQIVPMARREMQADDDAYEESDRNRVVRRALQRYIDRELLFKEARSRGISADQRALDWAYDQARREHPDEEAWVAFLAQEGLDPQSFKTEMRVQHTVSALLREEVGEVPVSEEEARSAYEAESADFVSPGATAPPFDEVREEVKRILRQRQLDEVTSRLLEKLRARARIETFL